MVTLEIDNRLCYQASDKCFPDAVTAADYLAALSAVERLEFPYPLKSVKGESPLLWVGGAVGESSIFTRGSLVMPLTLSTKGTLQI